MKKIILFIVVVATIASCGKKEFKELGDEIEVKLLSFDEANRRLGSAEFIDLSYSIVDTSKNHELFQSRQIFKGLSGESLGSKVLFDDLKARQIGDSLIYRLPCDLLNSGVMASAVQLDCDGASDYLLNLKINEAWTEEEYEAFLAQQRFSDPLDEVKFLEIHLNGFQQPRPIERLGHLFVDHVESSIERDSVQTDSLVRIHYKGYLLNGKLVDISPPDSGLVYRRGDQGQVIEGLDFMVSQSHYGDSLRVYIPPYLAFGSRGAANGQIPPFSPLLYELRIEKVK